MGKRIRSLRVMSLWERSSEHQSRATLALRRTHGGMLHEVLLTDRTGDVGPLHC